MTLSVVAAQGNQLKVAGNDYHLVPYRYGCKLVISFW